MQVKLLNRLWTFFGVAVVLAAGGCSESTGLGQLSASVEVSPDPLTLATVPITVRSQGQLEVRNTGAAQLSLANARIEGGGAVFTLGEVPAFVAPNQAVTVTVTGRAQTVGAYSAVVVLGTSARNSEEVRVDVSFQATEIPDCEDGNTCTANTFDAETNRCVQTFADGIACESKDRCIINAVCQQGVCLGEQKRCDDGNPCTRDVCRQTDGECLAVVPEDACNDDNPCTDDSCTAGGCVNEPKINGALCDDGDSCTDVDTCFGGECTGISEADGTVCSDGNSCTINDRCSAGVCTGDSIVEPAAEGEVLFSYPLPLFAERSFLHRRHVSMTDDGVFYGLDHRNLPNDENGVPQGLEHIVFAFEQCGTHVNGFKYQPPDPFVSVIAVRRSLQIGQGEVRMVVGIRQLFDNGFEPQTTAYVLPPFDRVEPDEPVLPIRPPSIRGTGGETGRSLLPDGSQIWGTVVPLNFAPFEDVNDARQNLVIVRGDRNGSPLWRHERSSEFWSEFLGVAGPRVLFWSEGRFGALDFNTGAQVWSQQTAFITSEIALSTQLNLGVARASSQILAVEILNGTQVFTYPSPADALYVPRTDPIISADGRILFMMERRVIAQVDGENTIVPTVLTWVELDTDGQLISETELPYAFPGDVTQTLADDRFDDPYPTVADDGITYVGFGDSFWALEPGGRIRWTLTSTNPAAFTATVPLLRDDGVLLMSRGSREIIGVRTNGGQMSEAGWASYRHDNNRTNFTP